MDHEELKAQLNTETFLFNEMAHLRFLKGLPLTDEALLCQKALLEDLFNVCTH